MLSSKTQSFLADFLKSVAEAEISVEITRLVLAEKKEFDLYGAFRYIDRLNKGYINAKDIREFLEDVDIVAQEAQILYFFHLYDSDDDFKLSFSDFKNAFLPTTDLGLRENAASRIGGSNQSLSYAASWALARVFEKEIQAYKNLELKRGTLMSQFDWDIKTVFNTLDERHIGYIDTEAIDIFFKNSHQISTLNEIDALFRRADKNRDGRIDFSEFKMLIQQKDSHDRKVLGNPSPRKWSRQRSPKNRENDSVGRNDRLPNTSPFNLQNSPRVRSSGSREYSRKEEILKMKGSPRRRASPIQRESPVKRESLRLRGSPMQRRSPRNREAEYNYYLKETPRISPRIKNFHSPRQSNPTKIKASPYKSPSRETKRLSPMNRSKSPSLKREITDYRVDSAFRTVKKFDTPTNDSIIDGRLSPTKQSNVELSPRVTKRSTGDLHSRSKSPKFKSDITEYRLTSNFRTVKTFENPDEIRSVNSPPREKTNTSGILISDNQRERSRSPRTKERFNVEAIANVSTSSANKSERQKSPKFRMEPTYYREEAALRTVKVFENKQTHQIKSDFEFRGSKRGSFENRASYDINKRLEYY